MFTEQTECLSNCNNVKNSNGIIRCYFSYTETNARENEHLSNPTGIAGGQKKALASSHAFAIQKSSFVLN